MTTEQHYFDPIAEGLTHSGQRLVQLIAISAAAKQVHVRHQLRLQRARQMRALEAERRINMAMKAAFERARTRWAPAHDREWLRQADLLRVAEAWSAALPYAAEHTAAASAVRKCEKRLRDLHPHAMQHYDRFRNAGLSPEEAMREAAPFFTRTPDVRTGDPAPQRRALPEGDGIRWTTGGHSLVETERRQQQYAVKFLNGIKTQHQEPEGLHPEDLYMALKIATNLPGKVISRAVGQVADDMSASAVSAADGTLRLDLDAPADVSNPGLDSRAPAKVAKDDFPYEIREVMHLVSQQPADHFVSAMGHRSAPSRNRRPSR